MTATSARVRAGSAGWSAVANSRSGPEEVSGAARRLLLLRAGQRPGEVGRRGLRLADDLHLQLDGQLGRDVRGEGGRVGRVERDVPLPRRRELVLVVVAGQDLLEAQHARPGRRARLRARGGRALEARRGRVVGPAALLAELLAQGAEDVEEVVEVREALVVAVGQRIGLDLRRVDGGLDPQHLALGEAHLPVDRLARGHGVVVGAGPEQRRGVERAAAHDGLGRAALGEGRRRQRERGGEDHEGALHDALLRRSATAPAKPSAARPPPTRTSSAVAGGSLGDGDAGRRRAARGLGLRALRRAGVAAVAAEDLDGELDRVGLAAGGVEEVLGVGVLERELDVVAPGLGERLVGVGLAADADRARHGAEAARRSPRRSKT